MVLCCLNRKSSRKEGEREKAQRERGRLVHVLSEKYEFSLTHRGHTLSRTHPPCCIHARTNKYVDTQSVTHTHTYTDTYTITHIHTQTHTCTRGLSRTCTHTTNLSAGSLSHTFTLTPSWPHIVHALSKTRQYHTKT